MFTLVPDYTHTDNGLREQIANTIASRAMDSDDSQPGVQHMVGSTRSPHLNFVAEKPNGTKI